MQYTMEYPSPLGEMLIACDDEGLTGVWFYGQKHFGVNLSGDEKSSEDHPLLLLAAGWLDKYFSGENPGSVPPLHASGTDFQVGVWDIIRPIPYGKTTTYGDIAKELTVRRGGVRVSARAVGGAVSRNPISVIVPCHRVVSKNGRLAGYAGGLMRKKELLTIEGVTVGASEGDDHSRLPT